MCKWIAALVVIFSVFIQYTAFAYEDSSEISKDKALIVYDSRCYYGYSDNIVESLEGLLSHFKIGAISIPQEKYQSGMCSEYDFIFIVGIDSGVTDYDFISDLKIAKGTVVWLGKGVSEFLRDNDGTGLEYSGIRNAFVQVTYKSGLDQSASLSKPDGFDIDFKREFTIVEPSLESSVYAYLYDGNTKVPFAVNEGDFWHVSRFENQGILFYIVADIMYDILGETDFEQEQTYIRIEDVHPMRNTKTLRAVADYLHGRGIPFMIALIPVYKDPTSSHMTTIDERPEFANTIRYMQDRGGSVILHGYTHQEFKTETSGEGFEFWNGIENAPLDASIDIEQYVFEKVYSGLSSCISNGIYPLGFESPHYAIDIQGYREIKKYFSTYVGQLQENDMKFGTTAYPYKIYDTERVNKLLPENLGYVDPENPFTLEEIFENYDNVDIVRGNIKGVFFHPYLDIAYLKSIVEELERRGAVFYDMKKDEHWVRCNGISIESKGGNILLDINANQEIAYEEHFYESEKEVCIKCNAINVILKDDGHVKYRKQSDKSAEKETKSEGSITNRISRVNDFLIIVISVFCILFLVIFTVSRNRNRKNLFR